MKNKPLISVIVPVYNVKDYLGDCLNSIINQTYKNLEIIVVDDGSTDGSSKICDMYVKKDDRFKVNHQENCGVAITRRNAVLRASGEYICFVDADDKIDESMVQSFIETIGRCDVVTCGCYCEKESGEYFKQTDFIEEGIYDNVKSMRYVIANMLIYKERFEYGLLPYLCNKMFRGKLLKEVISAMNSNLTYAEDAEVLFQYILKCESVCVTHKCMYYYRYRKDSTLRTANKNYMHDLNRIYLALEHAFEKHPQRDILLHQLQLFVVARIYAIPEYMWFPEDTQVTGYVFPYSDLAVGSKIILYGAGQVGMRYYRQIHRQKLLQMVLWVDKNWQQYIDTYIPVSSLEQIYNYQYDYIVIAVKRKELAVEIRSELMEMGIAEDQILWRVPAVL